ncbi:peptidoglycan-N-acetylmuramic acid deacetylase [Clostridium cavendishii DSM 21758]|uniref:Peptidoglycan-N-acetylmuramic acid deacetylase n=1 Tax=Clostridium cavendishii DSM 21758 TaxID=1121302 RepID=A0A1M6KQM7_9CLOT|nr:delta-lactam-biosynthetic de-N-acetylase [Clostridium cavendishii]SHJ61222.1 peptidoglycan-N-acetylmuramic acid deacetylase [Clostridium cavendishii DSM 21758]
MKLKIVSLFLVFTNLFCTPAFSFTLNDTLSSKEYSWYYIPQKDSSPLPPKETPFIKNHKVFYIGDSSKKELFLTFDEGYENGNTSKILDILKENKVPAAFFVTKPYIKQNPDLIKRMVNEGHLVCNHTSHHPSMATIKDVNTFNKEFTDVEVEYKNLTGLDMPKFFRPPMGKYSELSLKYTDDLGYSSVFWSFAYKDWLIDNQPSPSEAKEKILGKTHNGGIMLLHAVSKTNTNLLDDILKSWKNQGYELKSLNDLKK